MNLRRLTARTAVAVTATALAAGALVGLGATAANAATVSNTYTCTPPGGAPAFDTMLTVTGALPVPQFWAGAPVPKDILSITVDASLDPTTAAELSSLTVTSVRSDNFALPVGKSSAPIPLTGTFSDAGGGAKTWNATGKNKVFTTPAPGLATATLPSAFTFIATTTGFGDVPVPCVLKTGETAQELTSIQLLKQTGAITAKAPKKVKKGKLATVAVKASSVSFGDTVPTGKVTVKEGKKVLGKGTLSKGKVTIKLGKKLKVGTHKLTVSYAGTPSISGASAKTVLKVVKK